MIRAKPLMLALALVCTSVHAAEYYVRPTNGNNGNAGTSHAAAWQTLAYAVANITPGAGGDRINVCNEAVHTLAANLDITNYGLPSAAAPFTLQGYETTAGDNPSTQAVIDGAGSYSITSSAEDYCNYVDLEIRNSGSSQIITMDDHSKIIRCTIHNCTSTGITIHGDDSCTVRGCYIYDMDGEVNVAGWICNNYFANGTNDADSWIECELETTIERNIFSVDGATNAIIIPTSTRAVIVNNTIYSAGGTGGGIVFSTSSAGSLVVMNNLIEGFSGTGGVGIDWNSCTWNRCFFANNSFRTNATDEDNKPSSSYFGFDEGNEDVGDTGTMFEKSGSDTYSNRATYFEPLDVGSVFSGSWFDSRLDRGAIQHEDAGGGSGGSTILIDGGLVK